MWTALGKICAYEELQHIWIALDAQHWSFQHQRTRGHNDHGWHIH
jgi:hypothetical protein